MNETIQYARSCLASSAEYVHALHLDTHSALKDMTNELRAIVRSDDRKVVALK